MGGCCIRGVGLGREDVVSNKWMSGIDIHGRWGIIASALGILQQSENDRIVQRYMWSNCFESNAIELGLFELESQEAR